MGSVGTVLGGFREVGSRDSQIDGVSARKVLPAWKNLPARKILPAQKILPALWQ